MTQAPACSDAGKRGDQDGGADPGRGNDTKRDAYPQSRARRHRRDRGKGAERSRIQESEQEEREDEGSDTRVRAGETTDDGDTDDVVEAARKRRTGYRGSTEGGRERERLRPLVLAEEPLPAECLERVRKQKEGGCDSHSPEIDVAERPADRSEVPRDEGECPDGRHTKSGGHDERVRAASAMRQETHA